MRFHGLQSLCLLLLLGTWDTGRQSGLAEERLRSPAADALESIFSPRHAPARRTMGLLQRSFLDLVEDSRSQLEVALVVDGTDSMSADLEGVRHALRRMVEDLRRYRGEDVSFALVVYRDVGAPSGEVSILLNQFTSDPDVLENAWGQIRPETGAPYFPELIDLGVHVALSKLDWSEDPDTTRWLFVFGDAPPYDPDFDEPETGARRRYDTDLLINLANRKEIRINTVVCTSRPEEQEVYLQVLDKTRQFMNALATNTGGLMLDLSYPDIRKVLAEAAGKPRTAYQPVGRITREEVQAARALAEQKNLDVAQTRRIRVAVVPHLPLNRIRFDPDLAAVQVATELRQKFQMIPRLELASPVDIERELRRLRAAGVPEEQWLQALALRLRADYVVWGDYQRREGVVAVRSALYTKQDGKKLVEADVLRSDKTPELEFAGRMADQIIQQAVNLGTEPALVATLASVQQDSKRRQQLLAPVSHNPDARSELLAGLEALEQALAYPAGSSDAQRLLELGERSLTRATGELDLRNPFGHLLLASCYFNQAQFYSRQGQAEEARERSFQFAEALKRAFRHKDDTPLEQVKLEIEADYSLLIQKNYARAIESYQALAQGPKATQLHSARRAHWMLAGIYSGDWGVDPQIIDAAQARQHVIQILAHWPDSNEAKFIKDNLRWDDEKGENQFEHFPKEHQFILAGLESP